MLPVAEYSNSSLNKYKGDRNTTPDKSGVQCRRCTPGQLEEVRCKGPCNLVRPISHFSKNTRRKDTWVSDYGILSGTAAY